VAQVTAICQTLLRILPPGTMPPNVIKYDASSVPILQLGLSSPVLSEQAIADIGANFIRTQLATVQGASVPMPYGGKYREVMVDLNPDLWDDAISEVVSVYLSARAGHNDTIGMDAFGKVVTAKALLSKTLRDIRLYAHGGGALR
jgi:hypothetical protein